MSLELEFHGCTTCIHVWQLQGLCPVLESINTTTIMSRKQRKQTPRNVKLDCLNSQTHEQ